MTDDEYRKRWRASFTDAEKLRALVCVGDKACGREIPLGEEYRCLDCDAVMHKRCLRWHCANDEKDREIYYQQIIIDGLRMTLERLGESQ